MMVWSVCVVFECVGVPKGSPVCFRLKEIQMSEYDATTYERFSGAVRRQVQSLRIILDSLQVNISSQLPQRVCAVLPQVSECSFLSFLSQTHTHTHIAAIIAALLFVWHLPSSHETITPYH